MFDNSVIDLQPGDRLKLYIERDNFSYLLIDVATPMFESTDSGDETNLIIPDAYHWMVMIDLFFKAQLLEKTDHRKHVINNKPCLRWNEENSRYE
jgi:hypothetical protein